MALEKTVQIKNIFKPGIKVTLMIEQSFLRSIAEDATVYDCIPSNKEIIISSEKRIRTPEPRKQKIFLTTLLNREFEPTARFGIEVKIEKTIENYQLKGGEKVRALLLKYFPPLEKTTLRETFRIQPNSQFVIQGSINNEYHSGRENFHFDNISLTGAGIIVPKKGNCASLLDWKKGKQITIGLKLSEHDEKEEKITETEFTAKAEIIRVNFYFSERSGFMGIRFTETTPANTRKLTAFITSAQRYNIRKNRPL